MHAAPPVAVRCTAGWAWRSVQAALPALAAGVFIFWSLSIVPEPAAGPLRLALAVPAALVVGAVAWWRSSGESVQTLEWDGQRWSLDGQPGALQLMVDLGGALLLRHDGKRWLVAGRGDAGAAWHALRVAVHARSAGTPPPQDDGRLNA